MPQQGQDIQALIQMLMGQQAMGPQQTPNPFMDPVQLPPPQVDLSGRVQGKSQDRVPQGNPQAWNNKGI